MPNSVLLTKIYLFIQLDGQILSRNFLALVLIYLNLTIIYLDAIRKADFILASVTVVDSMVLAIDLKMLDCWTILMTGLAVFPINFTIFNVLHHIYHLIITIATGYLR